MTHAEQRERRKQIVQLARDGVSDAEIALRFGFHMQYVRQIRRDGGLVRPRGGPWSVARREQKSAEVERHYYHLRKRNAEIIEARLAGETLDQIGERFKLTRERVRQIVNKLSPKTNEIGKVVKRVVAAAERKERKARALAKRRRTPKCTECGRRFVTFRRIHAVCSRACWATRQRKWCLAYAYRKRHVERDERYIARQREHVRRYEARQRAKAQA